MKTGMGPALVLALGVAAAGWSVGNGFVKGRTADRFVTVKGASEREVQAEAAFWLLRYVATDNDLTVAQAEIDRSQAAVRAFLTDHGIAREAVQVNSLEVHDKEANAYGSRDAGAGGRYVITQTLMVSSDDVNSVKAASQSLGDLVNAGVVLGGTYGGPSYHFRGLNALKPAMIAEATASARAAAEKFAQDSGARVGEIRRANQGVFQVLARDRAPGIAEEHQLDKVVRVVSTVEYSLD